MSKGPIPGKCQGQPVLLLGGTWQDNLFNHPNGLERHLDLLKSCGGNYVRNVMSHRNVGNVFAFKQVDGKFDLDQWNDEYWRRFDNFLKLTRPINNNKIYTFDRDANVALGRWWRNVFGGCASVRFHRPPSARRPRRSFDIARSAWQPPQTITGGKTLEIKAPGQGHWAVLITAAN